MRRLGSRVLLDPPSRPLLRGRRGGSSAPHPLEEHPVSPPHKDSRMLQAPSPWREKAEGRRAPAPSGLQGLGGGEEGGPARGRGRRGYKGSARGPAPARDAHVRSAPQPPPREPRDPRAPGPGGSGGGMCGARRS